MKRHLFSAILLVIIHSVSFSQGEFKTTNYFGVETFTVYVDISDDAEFLKDLLLDKNDICKIIISKTNLSVNDPKSKDEILKSISIMVDYNIHLNPYSHEQYYGNYQFRVLRVLTIPNSDYLTFPHVEIFSVSNNFINNQPSFNDWKLQINEVIPQLISDFVINYNSRY